MRLAYKIAIVKSGFRQYEIARAAQISEGRLSRFLRDRETIRPEEEARLREVLGLTEPEGAEHVAAG